MFSVSRSISNFKLYRTGNYNMKSMSIRGKRKFEKPSRTIADYWVRQTSFFQGTRQEEAAHRAGKAMEVAAVRFQWAEEYVTSMMKVTLRLNIWISSGVSKVSSPVWYFKNLKKEVIRDGNTMVWPKFVSDLSFSKRTQSLNSSKLCDLPIRSRISKFVWIWNKICVSLLK